MSTTLLLLPVRPDVGIPRSNVLSEFGPYVVEAADDWRLTYDSENSCDVKIHTSPTNTGIVTSLSIHRPCTDARLWDSLASILRSGRYYLVGPGTQPIVGDPTVAAAINPLVARQLGPPIFIADGRDLQDRVERMGL